MLSKNNQVIIAGITGIATAATVALVSGQFKGPDANSSPSPTPSPTETISNNSPSSPPVNTPPTPAPQTPAPTPPANRPKVKPMQIVPPTSGCKISMAIVNDPDPVSNPKLNVRQAPSTQSKKIDQLPNGTFVSVIKEENGWLQIREPSGWIAKNRTRNSCATIKEQIDFLPGGNEALVKGEIIGGGSHTYVLKAAEGQTLTIVNNKEVFPMVMAPNGKLLAGDPYKEGKIKNKTIKLPATGEYLFELDSNFKGFEYEFLVRLD